MGGLKALTLCGLDTAISGDSYPSPGKAAGKKKKEFSPCVEKYLFLNNQFVLCFITSNSFTFNTVSSKCSSQWLL